MRSILAVSFVVSIFAVCGCTVVEEPVSLSSMPPTMASSNQGYGGSSSVNPVTASAPRFAEAGTKVGGPSGNALMWSDKYEKLLEQTEKLRDQYRRVVEANETMKEQLSHKNAELVRTKQELKEANTILLDMRVELNSWKKDVLGFREEMRKSQNATLAALAKILRELGAEMRNPNAGAHAAAK